MKLDWIHKFLLTEEILRWVGKQLTGADDTVIDYATQKAEQLDREHLPGFEKRQKLYIQLKGTLNNAADLAINLLIEWAVAYIRMKQAKVQNLPSPFSSVQNLMIKSIYYFLKTEIAAFDSAPPPNPVMEVFPIFVEITEIGPLFKHRR